MESFLRGIHSPARIYIFSKGGIEKIQKKKNIHLYPAEPFICYGMFYYLPKK